MSLLDTIDGAFMNFAYGWAFSKPVRKVFYNITITGLSVAVALIIGTIELLVVLADKLSLDGGLWDFVAGLDLNLVGYVDRRRCSCSPGRSRSRSGASAASRSAGQRAAARASDAAMTVIAPSARSPFATSTTSRARCARPAAALRRPRAGSARGAVRRRRAGLGRVARRGAAAGPASDLASVYRNLEHLEELGVVRHVHFGHGPGLYALPAAASASTSSASAAAG